MQKVKMVGNSLAYNCDGRKEGVRYGDLTVGKQYFVAEFHSSGNVDVIDDVGDESVLFKGEYELVEVEDDV